MFLFFHTCKTLLDLLGGYTTQMYGSPPP